MRIALMSLVALSFIATSMSTGCAPKMPRTDAMMSAVRGYNENIRWRRYPEAAARIPGPQREPFLDEREALAEDLRVDDYEITRVKTGKVKGKSTARIQVQYMWHLDSRGSVHKTTTLQEWERRGGRWYLAIERRVRGKKMPGLAEPLPRKPKAPPKTAQTRPHTR